MYHQKLEHYDIGVTVATSYAIPGPNSSCEEMNLEGGLFWSKKAETAKIFRENLIISMYEWYEASTCCLSTDSPCYQNIKILWKKFIEFIEYWISVSDMFWKSLVNSILTNEICNEYKKAMIDLKCIIKQLFRLVDGDNGNFSLNGNGSLSLSNGTRT